MIARDKQTYIQLTKSRRVTLSVMLACTLFFIFLCWGFFKIDDGIVFHHYYRVAIIICGWIDYEIFRRRLRAYRRMNVRIEAIKKRNHNKLW